MIPCRREWLPTSVFLPGDFQGQRSLVGYSQWGCKEVDITEQHAHTHTHTHTHMCLFMPSQWLNSKESTYHEVDRGDIGPIPWLKIFPEWGHKKPTPLFLPRESHAEEPGRVPIGSQRIRHDWSDWAHVHSHTHKSHELDTILG